MKYEERESAQRPLIQLENLVKVYDTGALKVLGLKKINLTIHRGEFVAVRSEERRVGKECRSRWSPYH